MSIKKITPVLIVDAVEPCLPFWERQLRYEVTVNVPHHDKIGFVILKQGDSEVMLQSKASVEEDLPAIARKFSGRGVVLFAEVDSLDQIEKSLGDAEVVVPRRKTPYGATEIWVKEPSGNIVGFAELGK